LFAAQAPAEIGGEGEHCPDGFTQRAGEVDDGGVDGDDQVELLDEGGGVGEIVKRGNEIDQTQIGGRDDRFFVFVEFLKREEGDVGDLRQG